MKRRSLTLGFLTSLLAFALLPSTTARAQLGVGCYNLYQGSKVVGHVYVPGSQEAHSADARRAPDLHENVSHAGQIEQYSEIWVLSSEYSRASSAGPLTIVPVPGTPAPETEEEIEQAPFADDTVRIRKLARELDAVPDVPPSEWSADADVPDPSTLQAATMEIWQRSGSQGEQKLVGFIYQDTVAVEHWCLSSEYIYPTPANGMLTELRPASPRGRHLLGEAMASTPPGFRWRYIHVTPTQKSVRVDGTWIVPESLSDEPMAAACALVQHRTSGEGLLTFLFLSFVGLLIRRFRRQP